MMDFNEEFEFLERELRLDYDDTSLRATQRKVLELERRLDQILKDDTKFPTLSQKQLRSAVKGLQFSRLKDLKVKDFDELARSELRKLKQVPERMWSAFNTLNLMNPGKIPSSVVTLVNTRMREYNQTAKDIETLLKSKKDNPAAFTPQDEAILDDKINNIRHLEANFLHGVDDHIVRLATVFSKDVKNLDEYTDVVDLKLKGISDTAANIQSTGGALFAFLRTGNSLPQVASELKKLLSNGYSAYLKVFLQNLEQGRAGRASNFNKTLAGKGSASLFASKLANLGSSFINHIIKFAGPYAKLAALAVSIATYFISKRQERIQFNSTLTKSLGLIDGLAMMDFSIKDPSKRMEAYYTTAFDYFTDRDTEYSVTLPNGLTATRSSNSLDLNLDTDKYVDLLGDLVQAGVTMGDIEQEFGMTNIKPNLLGNVRTDVIPNLKTPLEQYYTVAKAFNLDPAEVAKVLGEWKYNYGDLTEEINKSFGEIYVQAKALGVKSSDLFLSVIDLSNKFSVYSNQATQLSRALAKMLSKGLYGLEQGKQLLEGVLTEIKGFSIQQLENLITQLYMDSKDGKSTLKQLFTNARNNLQEELDKKRKELSTQSSVVGRDQVGREISFLEGLIGNADSRIKEINIGSLNFKQMSGFFDAYAQVNVSGNLNLLDKAIQKRREVFIKANKGRSANLMLALNDMANVLQTLNLDSQQMRDWASQSVLPVQSRVYDRPIRAPKPMSNDERDKAFETMQNAALNLMKSTEPFAGQVRSTVQPLTAKIYNASLSMWRFIQDIFGRIFGTDPEKTTPTLKGLEGIKVKDLSGNIPSTLIKKPPLSKVSKIVIGSNKDFSTKVTTKGQQVTQTYHYGINEKGELVQYIPENVQATGLGQLSKDLGTALKKGTDLSSFALSININPPTDTITEKYYHYVAKSLATLLVQYKLKPSDIDLQSQITGTSGVSLPQNFKWEKLKQYLTASYEVQSNGGQPPRAANLGNSAAQITSNVKLQDLFTKAFTKQVNDSNKTRLEEEQVSAYSEYSSVESFGEAFIESISQFSTDTLKNAQKTGSDRQKLFDWFKGRFNLSNTLPAMADLFDAMLARAIEERKILDQIKLNKNNKPLFVPNTRLQLRKVSDVYGGADVPFRAAFAQKLGNGNLANSVTVQQHFVNVFLSDTNQTLDQNKIKQALAINGQIGKQDIQIPIDNTASVMKTPVANQQGIGEGP